MHILLSSNQDISDAFVIPAGFEATLFATGLQLGDYVEVLLVNHTRAQSGVGADECCPGVVVLPQMEIVAPLVAVLPGCCEGGAMRLTSGIPWATIRQPAQVFMAVRPNTTDPQGSAIEVWLDIHRIAGEQAWAPNLA